MTEIMPVRRFPAKIHDYVYRRSYTGEVGCHLRSRYEQGGIKNGKEFWEVLKDVLSGSQGTEKHGCYALKTTHGKHLAGLKHSLNQEAGGKDIQLVTISRPTAYGEYVPYAFAKDEQEFSTLVRAMRR